MRHAGYTKQERVLLTVVRVLTVAFLLTALTFAIAPDYILDYMKDIGNVFFEWNAPSVDLGGQHFWLIMAVSFTATLGYLCFLAQSNLIRNIGYLRPVIFSQLLTTIGFIICIFISDAQFFYLVGAIVDGLIFVVLWRLYAMAMRSRN